MLRLAAKFFQNHSNPKIQHAGRTSRRSLFDIFPNAGELVQLEAQLQDMPFFSLARCVVSKSVSYLHPKQSELNPYHWALYFSTIWKKNHIPIYISTCITIAMSYCQKTQKRKVKNSRRSTLILAYAPQPCVYVLQLYCPCQLNVADDLFERTKYIDMHP